MADLSFKCPQECASDTFCQSELNRFFLPTSVRPSVRTDVHNLFCTNRSFDHLIVPLTRVFEFLTVSSWICKCEALCSWRRVSRTNPASTPVRLSTRTLRIQVTPLITSMCPKWYEVLKMSKNAHWRNWRIFTIIIQNSTHQKFMILKDTNNYQSA